MALRDFLTRCFHRACKSIVCSRCLHQMVAKHKEPITPFVDRVRQLFEEKGVSTVLVMGGCGDYFSVCNRVIQMLDYRPVDVTARARRIARDFFDGRQNERGRRFGEIRERIPRLPDTEAGRFARGRRTLKAVEECVLKEEDQKGLETLSPYLTGDLARCRALELAAALNRMRSLEVKLKISAFTAPGCGKSPASG